MHWHFLGEKKKKKAICLFQNDTFLFFSLICLVLFSWDMMLLYQKIRKKKKKGMKKQ